MSSAESSSSSSLGKNSTIPFKSVKSFQNEKHYIPPLEEYVPLGCVSLETLSTYYIHVGEKEWIEIADSLPEPTLEFQNIWNALQRLWRAAWIRLFRLSGSSPNGHQVWRVYVLPSDVSRSCIDRNRPALKKSLDQVLAVLNVSPKIWATGMLGSSLIEPFDRWATAESSSLFYLFNTLPSPSPSTSLVRDRWSRKAMETLLQMEKAVSGLATELYPYQKRAAAEMLRREVAPQIQLDPRLEERRDPVAGQTYYYGAHEEIFLRQPRFYDAVRGGILAETMGLGKTLICIAVILATKGHYPCVPPQYADSRPPVRSATGSLVDMAAATIARNSIPWRKFFAILKEGEGYEVDECAQTMESYPPQYEIPPALVRVQRNSTISAPPEIVRMCYTTIVVVPKNLMHQWRTEFAKHVQKGALQILEMEDRSVALPTPEVLATYDIILFSRTRFESEHKGGNNNDFYESPLTRLHWLRIIIDEGHSFSAANTHAAVVAERLVRAERRWVVSGTPAKDLMGVEVETAATMNTGDYEDTKAIRRKSLEERRTFNMVQEEFSGAVKSLGSLTSRFLKAQPWSVSPNDQFKDAARWDDHIYRHESFGGKTFTSFSSCLRRVLENLVIKTQPEDVERDIVLPPLTHSIVKLEPSFVDKLTINLFVLLFTTNAVTSERRDQDYLFHRASQHHLHRLIANLRQSAFFWTGLQEDSVRSSLDVTRKYLDKKETNCTPEDRRLLEDTATAANAALTSSLWKWITRTSDMGIFVDRFPENCSAAWSFDGCTEPMAMSLSLSIEAQNHVNDRLSTAEPTNGLKSAGELAKLEMLRISDERRNLKTRSDQLATENTAELSNKTDFELLTRLPASGASNMTSPPKKNDKTNTKSEKTKSKAVLDATPKHIKRRLHAADSSVELPPDSELGSAVMTGTTSSKFSYLIDRVVALQETEKILIFYEGNHIAFFLSEVFDLLNIKYLLYANTLSGERRGKYAVLFETDPSHRVLLMDIKQAAHGLNVSSASRVFFVNPVFRPNVEAQAIKRAHRIGQLRPVFVETLILKGTVEEAMHERATKMTNHEHLQAKTIEDDGAMARIIQDARVLPIKPEECQGQGQFARLSTPQQIFGRPGRSKDLSSKLEVELFGEREEEEEEEGEVKPTTRKRGKTSKGTKSIIRQEDQRNTTFTERRDLMNTTTGSLLHESRAWPPRTVPSRISLAAQSLFGGD